MMKNSPLNGVGRREKWAHEHSCVTLNSAVIERRVRMLMSISEEYSA